MKKIISILIISAMITTLFACGNQADKKKLSETNQADKNISNSDIVTLSFWSWLPTTEQSDTIIKEFEKENPNIKIEYTRTEQDDYIEKLQVAMASGTGPDLFGLTTGAMKNQYAPFTENMKELADKYWQGWNKKISETAVNQCLSKDETMIGMPLLVAGMTDLLYNKTLMEECGIEKVPTTYTELKDATQKAKAKGYVCVAAGASDDWINSDWFVQISNEFEQGAVYAAEKGERKWTDQCFVDTMLAWQRLFTDGVFEDGALGVSTYPDARDQYFFARKSVFFMTGSWHLGPTSPTNTEIQGTEIANKGDIIGMSVFPSMADSGVITGTSGVDIMLAVNKDCKNKEAAMKFVEYMANGAGQQYWVDKLQGAPVSNEITYKGIVDGKLQQQSIDEVNKYVSNAVGNRQLTNSKIVTAIQVAMQNVAAGGDPLEELKEVQNIADSQ